MDTQMEEHWDIVLRQGEDYFFNEWFDE